MIPVVFIHTGFQDYLKYTILESCKRNKTVLIGTDNNVIDTNLKFYNISEYQKYVDGFSKIYEHKSTNPYDYELFCFLRWFILKDFMEKENIDVVFYADSDVMLYVNVNDEFEKFSQYDLTLLHRTAAVSSFFTKTGLDNFCSFLTDTFSNKNGYNYKKISSHYDIRQSFGLSGGICDMTYFDFFHYWDESGGPGKVGEMMSIINDSTYDHNINVADQYFDFSGMKNVQMIDDIPYVYSNKLKKLIKFNSLHFQGPAKVNIKKFYKEKKMNTTKLNDREALAKHFSEFISLYRKKPVVDNTGGMKFPHMFATYCLLKELNPKLIIESGVWKGQGTWLMENVCPDAQIISIDPNPGVRIYTSQNSYYTTDDITTIDWDEFFQNNNYDTNDILVFLDDHQNILERLKFLHSNTNIKHILYEDNYPSNQGDCLSLKKIKENKRYVIDSAGHKTYYDSNQEDLEYLNSITETYFEFPPVYKPEYTRWGDRWDENYETPNPIITSMTDELIEFESELKDYTWFCYLQLK